MASESFKEAYGVLQQHAQTLRNQQEPNIDDLLTIVTESVEAYKVCNLRIEAVEKALEKALSDTTGVPKQAAHGAKTPLPIDSASPEDDIPF
ncbi:exodeoxyribonuclease VII small subunit [Polaromonas sp. P1(28)-13]|nr:exodeoxyribonuclease VII small subunit [Polaromonas sp. P1(28)-13]